MKASGVFSDRARITALGRTRRRRRDQLPAREVRAERRPGRRRRRPRRRRRARCGRRPPRSRPRFGRADALRGGPGPPRRGWRVGAAPTARTSYSRCRSGRRCSTRRAALVADLAHPGARVVVARGRPRRRGQPALRRPDPAGAEAGRAGARGRGGGARASPQAPRRRRARSASRTPASRRCCAASRTRSRRSPTTRSRRSRRCSAPSSRRTAASSYVADVPGLLEGASEGVGLGHEFLAHLERARLLVHVIDAHDGDPEQRFRRDRPRARRLRRRAGRAAAGRRPEQDRPAGRGRLRASTTRVYAPCVRTSAATGEGIDRAARRAVRGDPGSSFRAAGHRQRPELADYLVYRPRASRRGPFRVLRTDRGFLVTGRDLGSVPRRGHRGGAPAGGRPRRRRGRARGRAAGAGVTTGLLGGAFDPPHSGHLVLADAAIRRFELERLVVVVTGDPPHKRVATDAETRYRLAEAAFAGRPRRRAVPLRARGAGPVVHRSRRRAGRARVCGDVVFLVGADEFASFLSWHDPDGVLEPVRLGVATRPGYRRERLDDGAGARSSGPTGRAVRDRRGAASSSTDVRERVARGEPIDDLVPAAGRRADRRAGLYR